jgi:hypothetical protein
MAALKDIAKLIRSKNAGPFELTVDVMFADARTFNHVVASRVITAETMGRFFQVDPARVQVFNYQPANAIKVTFPRAVISGDPADTDLFGGQQFGPLVDLPVPDLPAH